MWNLKFSLGVLFVKFKSKKLINMGIVFEVIVGCDITQYFKEVNKEVRESAFKASKSEKRGFKLLNPNKVIF